MLVTSSSCHLCFYCILSCSVVSDCTTLWTVARKAPLSVGFSRQEYWSGLPFPHPGDLPDPGIELTSAYPAYIAGGFFTTEPPEKPPCFWPNGYKSEVSQLLPWVLLICKSSSQNAGNSFTHWLLFIIKVYIIPEQPAGRDAWGKVWRGAQSFHALSGHILKADLSYWDRAVWPTNLNIYYLAL